MRVLGEPFRACNLGLILEGTRMFILGQAKPRFYTLEKISKAKTVLEG